MRWTFKDIQREIQIDINNGLTTQNFVNISQDLDISGNSNDGNIIINTHDDKTDIKAIHLFHKDNTGQYDVSNCYISYEHDDSNNHGIVLNGNLEYTGNLTGGTEIVTDSSSGGIIWTRINNDNNYNN